MIELLKKKVTYFCLFVN